MQSLVLLASWYDDFQKCLQEYPSEIVELRELVWKLSNRKEDSDSHGVEKSEASSSEVENVRLLVAAKDQELLERKQKHAELEVTNAKLEEILDATTQKSRELVDHVHRANVHRATVEHFNSPGGASPEFGGRFLQTF